MIDKENQIVAGNGTFRAAKKLKWKNIDAVRTTLKGDEAKAFALADNRTQELSAWNSDILVNQLLDLKLVDFDIEAIGFGDEFLKGIGVDSPMRWAILEDDEVTRMVPKERTLNVTRGDYLAIR